MAESGGLAPQPAKPIQLFSKQRPHLGGFTLQEKWRTERAARRWRSPEERGVSDAGAREAGSGANKAVVLPHRPRGPKRLPTDHRASRFYSPENWRRREVTLPSGKAARPASNGCRRLGRIDSLRSPLRGRPSVDPSPLRSVASESPPGRNCTCVDPLRRRRPELLFAVPPASRAPARLTLATLRASPSPRCALRRPRKRSGPHGGTPTRNTAFEAPHDCNLFVAPPRGHPVRLTPRLRSELRLLRAARSVTTRGKWPLHEDLHLDLELRGLASCLLDDEGKKWGPPPESHRPGPTYKVGTSLTTSDGHWSPRRVTLPVLALI